MHLTQFGPIARRIAEGNAMEIRLGEGTAFSLPVAVRRDDAQYDAAFLYQIPAEGEERAPRPFAWVLFDAASGEVAQLCRCDLVDFVPPGSHPVGTELPMALPKLSVGKKRGVMLDKLYTAYEEIREFVFDESLTRPQAAAVSTYKEMFQKVSYPAHYPFYHALSPAFFHWLRMPLPKEALMNPARPMGDLQKDGYQLLILENLQQLVRQFQDKIAKDNHQDHLFDEMHRELQEYKNDMLGSLTLAMERDVIQVIDDVAKSVEAYRGREGTAEEYVRLFALLEGVETDLCDLLYRHGVEPFTVAGVDVSRQKIVQTIPTGEAGLDKTVAARNGRGWEKDGRVIRPERVSVYVYTPEADGGAET